jgi:hypothetical protein
MSNFKSDLKKEALLAAFLDKHYEKTIGSVRRSETLDEQHVGIDFFYYSDNGIEYRCDEKAQLSYLNQELPTFALEIDYLKEGSLRKGWLFDSKKITDVYIFIFSIMLRRGSDQLMKYGQIESCEAVFVNRIRLLNELSKFGLTDAFCTEKSEEMRRGTESLKYYHYSGSNFQLSSQLAEQPVNLIVRKDFLVSIGKRYLFEGSF